MKTLILMRHAKSSWDDPRLSDHDRPLTKRGRAAAPLIGGWLRQIGVTPQQVISSTAERTAETWMRTDLEAEARFTRDLYHAGPAAMRRVLQTATADVVMMIGHNPGIAVFAHQLVQDPPNHTRFLDYPTAATTLIDFDIPDWTAVQRGTCRAFTTPHDLG